MHLLPKADWCFLALPYTAETQNLFTADILRQLPAHAVLVNVGRGETLVTADLCQVLREGHLGGAALDVISPKPQDPGDDLWQTPRLLITPYVASHCQERSTAIEQFCEQQCQRFMAGEPLQDAVDLESWK